MDNTIIVNLENITVKLPDSHIIVQKDDYIKLQKQAMTGQYLSLSDVLELLHVSRPWLLNNVLYKPDIRQEIDIDKNPDGFVKYPQNQGGKYLFLASKTKEFFENNFAKIL